MSMGAPMILFLSKWKRFKKLFKEREEGDSDEDESPRYTSRKRVSISYN